jgi:hypothetical protein
MNGSDLVVRKKSGRQNRNQIAGKKLTKEDDMIYDHSERTRPG